MLLPPSSPLGDLCSWRYFDDVADPRPSKDRPSLLACRDNNQRGACTAPPGFSCRRRMPPFPCQRPILPGNLCQKWKVAVVDVVVARMKNQA